MMSLEATANSKAAMLTKLNAQTIIRAVEAKYLKSDLPAIYIVAAFLLSSIDGTILATFVYIFLPYIPNVEKPENSDDAKELITLL